MGEIAVMRAEAEWQRAGAYAVRVQGMGRQHHISLREELDEHDCEGTRYIVLTDDEYPVATCRFFETGPSSVTLGRVVVLPEYRGHHLGVRVVKEAERWMRELGYATVHIDARLGAVGFYERLSYVADSSAVVRSGCFDCKAMHKDL